MIRSSGLIIIGILVMFGAQHIFSAEIFGLSERGIGMMAATVAYATVSKVAEVTEWTQI